MPWETPDGYVGTFSGGITDIQVSGIERICLSLLWSHFPVPIVETEHALLIRFCIWSWKFCWTATNGWLTGVVQPSLLFYMPLSSTNLFLVLWNYVIFTIVIQLPQAVLCNTSLPFNYCPPCLKTWNWFRLQSNHRNHQSLPPKSQTGCVF